MRKIIESHDGYVWRSIWATAYWPILVFRFMSNAAEYAIRADSVKLPREVAKMQRPGSRVSCRPRRIATGLVAVGEIIGAGASRT
jgi:hypothetical protein